MVLVVVSTCAFSAWLEAFLTTTRLRTASESERLVRGTSVDLRSLVCVCAATIVGIISSRAIVCRTLIALSSDRLVSFVCRALALESTVFARIDIRPPFCLETLKSRDFQKTMRFLRKTAEIERV